MSEMNGIGWTDGKVVSVAEHDDLVMASWMAEMAVRTSGSNLDWGEDNDNTDYNLGLDPDDPPKPQAPADHNEIRESIAGADAMEAERLSLAALHERRRVNLDDLPAYASRVRRAMKAVADQAYDDSDHAMAAHAIGEIQRLDRALGYNPNEHANVENPSSSEYRDRDWQPREGSPIMSDLLGID
jgi:hypothetical protein